MISKQRALAKIRELEAFIRQDEIAYPLIVRSIHNGQLIKFTSLSEGAVIWEGDSGLPIGSFNGRWMPHTDTEYWEPVAYDSARDLWDGQPVYCWDNGITHARRITFYDAKNKCTYIYDGSRDGLSFDDYEAVKPEHYTEWMAEAYKTLEK